MDLSRRIDQPELMDGGTVSSHQMKEALRFLSFVNKYFGGTSLVRRHLTRWSRSWKKDEPVTLLDIGTGGAEIPLSVADWAEKNGFSVSITAIDLNGDVAEIAQENARGRNSVTIQKTDFFEMADRGKQFDYVTASLFLHHVPPHRTTETLRAMDRLAKRGIIISDLHRSQPSYWTIKAMSYLKGNTVVRHDGPLSVQRAFRVKELTDAAETAGLSYLRAQKEPWCRISLAGEKP